MPSFARAFPLVALAVAACAATPQPAHGEPAAAAANRPTSFHLNAPLAAPKALRLYGFNGSIEATPSDDGRVDVRSVVRHGDASTARVVTRSEPGALVVCVLFADEPDSDCGADDDARHHESPNGEDARVDLVARVPRGVALVARSLNGDVSARDLSGDVDASTLNGDVKVSTTGTARASTLNGAVEAKFATPPVGPLSFESNNGDVRVTLPATSDATIEASTMNGELSSSVPMRIDSVPGGHGPKHGRAKLGSGAARIAARTLNGNVDVQAR
jgi:hypothetical protein